MGTILVMVGVEILSNKVKKVLTDQNVRNVEIISNYKYLSAKSKVFQDSDLIIYDQENRNLSFAELQKILDVQVIGRDIPVIQLTKPIDEKKLVEQVLALLHADFATEQTKEKKPLPVEQEVILKTNIFNSQDIKLEWTKQYEIGIELIDQEHRLIVENYNQLYLAVYENKGIEYYGKILDFLMDYVAIHFRHEEALQKQLSYPAAAEHQKLHMAFEKQVKELYASYQDKEICQKDLVLICLFIKKWLLEHILVEDKKIGEFSLTK